MALAVSADWFADGGVAGAALDLCVCAGIFSALCILHGDAFLLSRMRKYTDSFVAPARASFAGTAQQCSVLLSVGGVAAVVSAKSAALFWKAGAVIAERELVSGCFRVHLHGILSDPEFCPLDAATARIKKTEWKRRENHALYTIDEKSIKTCLYCP